MGSRGGVGIDIDLDKVPQRETGMTAYEMLLSESQERMLIVAEKGREEEVFQVFRKWGLDAVTIGVVTPDGQLRIRHLGEVVAEIPNPALADEAPKYDRPHNVKPHRRAPLEAPAQLHRSTDLSGDLLRLVASPDLCSKRWIWEQYDYMVRTNTIVGPGSDAAVVRIKETDQSIAMSLDGNGRYCYLDPREGAKLAVAECCRNLATTGAIPVAATNNLNFGNPERPEIMAQLVEAVEGIAEACAFFETPITGGNVSLYNETLGEGIYPTPVLGIIGLMKTATPAPVHFTREGAEIFHLGAMAEGDSQRFGSTQYAKVIQDQLWGLPPRLDMEREKRVHDAIRALIEAGLVESAHDISDGGLAVTLAECCTAELGAHVAVNAASQPEFGLFAEDPSRILVTVNDGARAAEIASKFGVPLIRLGATMKERLQIDDDHGEELINLSTAGLKQAFETSLPRLLQAQHD